MTAPSKEAAVLTANGPESGYSVEVELQPPKKRKARKRRFSDANYLVRDYLLAKDEEEKQRYFDRLVAYCFRASGKLYIAPEEWGTSCTLAKRDFIVDAILEYINRYADCCTRSEIEQLAFIGEFRHLARIVRLRIIDHIRRRYRRRKRAVVKVLSLDFALDEDGYGQRTTTGDTIGHDVSSGHSPLANHMPTEAILEFIDESKEEFLGLLGEAGLEVLLATVDSYPDLAGMSRREEKGTLTRAVAKRRGVSDRQARSDIRRLRERVKETMKTGGESNAVKGLLKLLRGWRSARVPKALRTIPKNYFRLEAKGAKEG